MTRPEIYFGELTNTDVYVKTRQKEFNYPQGETNSLTSYEGTGGIVLGGFFRRLLIALDRGDLTKLPFSDDVTRGQPAADAAQHPRARRGAGAVPHLRSRPLHRRRRRRPAVVDDGRVHDVGHVSRTRGTTALGRERINYIRNSVKVVDRRLRRHDDVLRVRHRGSDHRRLSRDVSDAVQGRVGDAGRPARARALSRAAAAAAGGGLRPVSHDRSGRVLQPRGSVDRRQRSRHERPARAGDAADGAELRADEAARRDSDSSSSRSCRSRRPTATT